MMAIPDNCEIEIEGQREKKTGERSVRMNIRTSAAEPNATIKQILTSEQAVKIGKQLIAAARVADGTE